MSHFYLTLPSNASMDCYGDNTATKYTTKLSQMMELDGDWEVGLTEFSCPGNFVNVRMGECRIRIRNQTSALVEYRYVKEGYYRDIRELVAAVNESLRASPELRRVSETFVTQCAYLQYREVQNAVEVTVKRNFTIRFNQMLSRKLGFSSTTGYSGKTTGSTPNADVDSIKSLYVYCDLLEPVPVGDVKVPLLRIINIMEKKEHLNTHRIMKRVLFLPVQKKHFDTVEIQILDDGGNIVPFEAGKSIVVLEFRRVVHPYFLGKP